MVGSIASSPAVDLSAVPSPVLVAQPDFETRFAAKLAQFLALYETATGTPFTALVESDPLYKVQEADAYDELVLAQACNDAARGMLLAYAAGTNLDQLGALFDVARFEAETDTAYRRRLQLAPHSFSVAGPELAYVYHAMSADSDVADAAALSAEPDDVRALVLQVLDDNAADLSLVTAMTEALDGASWPGDVDVVVLAASGDGVPSAEVLDAVDTVLQGGVRPLTDRVTVSPVELVDYAIEAELYVFAGPDQTLILETAQASLDAYLASVRKIGRDVARSALIAALHVGNVQRVDLISPAEDVVIGSGQVANPTASSVTIAGTEL